MDLHKSIRMVADTGKVLLGTNRARKIALNGTAKLVVIASNCPSEAKQDLEHYCKLASIPVLEFQGTSVELGTTCGRPFSVSVLTVLEPGNSDIMDAVRK